MQPRRQTWFQPQGSPWDEAAEVARVLSQAGYEAVFVGGCVRDNLLGRACHDCDLATNASPDQVEALFPLTVAVGKAFGVIIVVQRGLNIEVASFRHDGAYIDGRRPEGVRPGDEAGDMERRDFTINALVGDPQRQEIRDHVGGIEDLTAGVLRVVGDPHQRLREDRLRVLRALRFAARYDLRIAETTVSALHAIKPEGLSRERIWEEWHKALTPPESRHRWWLLLMEYQLLQHLIPIATKAQCDDLGAALHRHPSLDAATAQGLMILCCCPDPTQVEDWLHGEPISKQQRQFFIALQGQVARALGGLSALAHKRLARAPTAQQTAACLFALGQDDIAQGLKEQIAIEAARGAIPALLTGADLHRAGIQPGPQFAQLIRRAEDAWLLGELSDRDEALALVPHWVDED